MSERSTTELHLAPIAVCETGTSITGDAKCVFIKFVNEDIIVCWVPSHDDIGINEKADSASKSALYMPRVLYTRVKHHISQYVISTQVLAR